MARGGVVRSLTRLHVPRRGILQAELCQRVCLQYGGLDGGGVAFDGDGGGQRKCRRFGLGSVSSLVFAHEPRWMSKESNARK